jgi:hypothetical protein
MKIEFDQIDLSFENIDNNDERLKRISELIWKLLDEKFERDANSNSISSAELMKKKKFNSLTLDQVVVPPIHVDSGRSDYEIASHCASAIYRAVLMKLQ